MPCDRLLLDRAGKLFAQRLNFQDNYESLSDSELADMIGALRRIVHAYADWLQPATETEVLETLADFADMLQCDAPRAAGIALYTEGMQMPKQLLAIARRKVAASHRFSKLPLPRDFLNAVDGEQAWCQAKLAWVNTLICEFQRAADRRNQGRMI